MATWFVRPNISHSATRNGESYATAWGGWSEILWGIVATIPKVSPSDTLYVCGAHTATTTLSLGAHGATSPANAVVIRGDYFGGAGSFVFSSLGFLSATRQWTEFRKLAFFGAPDKPCIASSMANGLIIDSCDFSGGKIGVYLDSMTQFRSAWITNNTIHGQTGAGQGAGISHVTVSTATGFVCSGIRIIGNTIYNSDLYGISVNTTSASETTASYDDYFVQQNEVYNCAGTSIYLKACNGDQTTEPTIWSPGLVVSDNYIHNCGTTAGASGNHGGLLIMGFNTPLIYNNDVWDCYVTGGGIQTAKNKNVQIWNNDIRRIRSGTPTVGYQNGLPIDGQGIFTDLLTHGGLVQGNYIYDCADTGNNGSGAGLALWKCNDVEYVGNVVENCYRGVTFGNPAETANVIRNNTFINCNVGFSKVGITTILGNLVAKNNLLVNCATAFYFPGANPSITADFNNMYGSTTRYTGISAGANDTIINPVLDANYRPTVTLMKRTGLPLGGKDYYGKQFYNPPNIGAVDDHPTPAWNVVTREG